MSEANTPPKEDSYAEYEPQELGWPAPKLVVLGFISLAVGVAVIYLMASLNGT